MITRTARPVSKATNLFGVPITTSRSNMMKTHSMSRYGQIWSMTTTTNRAKWSMWYKTESYRSFGSAYNF